jgi:phosphatidylcholine synthase
MQMRSVAAGIAVHILTASGAAVGLIALHLAAQHDWTGCFAWLGLALLIDGIDGPIARKVDVAETLPRFSGVRLDLIVDYMNYCVVPAFIIFQSDFLPAPWNGLAGSFMVLTSLFHFSDRNSKTADGFFVGFPAIWNIVCLYFFVLGAGGWVVLATITVLGSATFFPVTWPHPLRARLLRVVTLIVSASWLVAAGYALIDGFPSSQLVQIVFVAAAAYVIALGGYRTINSKHYD